MIELRSVEVSGLSLDELFERCGVEQAVLLKVDIQGAERHMIEGGEKALSGVQSLCIEVCFKEFYEGRSDFFELDQMLRARLQAALPPREPTGFGRLPGLRERALAQTRLGSFAGDQPPVDLDAALAIPAPGSLPVPLERLVPHGALLVNATGQGQLKRPV